MQYTILIADPDWYIRAQLHRILDDVGYHIAETSDKAFLFALLQLHPVPLIVICRDDMVASSHDPLAAQCFEGFARHAFILLTNAEDAISTRSERAGRYRLPMTYDREAIEACVEETALHLVCRSGAILPEDERHTLKQSFHERLTLAR